MEHRSACPEVLGQIHVDFELIGLTMKSLWYDEIRGSHNISKAKNDTNLLCHILNVHGLNGRWLRIHGNKGKYGD